jgi:hypothetical protein
MDLVDDCEVPLPHRSEAMRRWGYLLGRRMSLTNGATV